MRVKLFILALLFASCSSKKQQKQKVVIGYNKKAIGYIYCDSALVTDNAYYLFIDTTTLKITKHDN